MVDMFSEKKNAIKMEKSAIKWRDHLAGKGGIQTQAK